MTGIGPRLAVLVSALLRPRDLAAALPTLLLVAAMGAIGTGMTVYAWHAGSDFNFAFGSWLPISDAKGWWDCGKDLEHASATVPFEYHEWCQRRPIYPAMLAGLSALTRDDTLYLLIAQSVILSVAAAFLTREAIRLCGALGGALVAILVLAYMNEFAFSQMMSEAAGLTFGLLGIALLLRGAEINDAGPLPIGIAALSLGLTARMGPMFALPAVVAWSMLAARRWRLPVARMLLFALLAMMAGPLVQSCILLATGGTIGNSGDNLSYTLYGLATGGRGWHSVVEDHPDVLVLSDAQTAQRIYALAWAAVREQPALLFQGLRAGLGAWWRDLFSNAPVGLTGLVRTILFPAGLVTLVLRRQDDRIRVIGALFLGETLSAPWIATDGGARVFAATAAADALIAALGLQSLGAVIAMLLRRPFRVAWPLPFPGQPFAPAVLLCAVFLLVILPAARIPAALLPMPLEAPSCGGGQKSLAVDVDRAFVLQKTPAGGRFEALAALPGDRLAKGAPRHDRWWQENTAALPDGTALIVFDHVDQDPPRPGTETLRWDGAPPLHRGDILRLCAEPKPTQKFVFLPLRTVLSGEVVPSR